MNQSYNNEGMVYKITAFIIFIILIVFIILVSISTANERLGDNPEITEEPATSIGDTASSTDVSDTNSHDTSTADTSSHDTDAPDTKAPETNIPDTPKVDAPKNNAPEDWANFLKNYPKTVLSETADAGKEYIDKLVFLGDSTTYGLRAYSMLSGGKNTTQVWTPFNGTLTLSDVSFATIVYPETNEQITIKEAITRKKPEYLVITLGVNGISFMDEDYFKSEYKWLLEMIQETNPSTKIICQSIFPVTRSYKNQKSINNSKINKANRWIVEVADEVGVKFIDTYSVLCDSEGYLPENYSNGDGLHLNSSSFTLELNNLRTHKYK